MPSTKIKFEQEDWSFIESYKESTGVSIQRFVTEAVKERVEKIKIQQSLKNLPFKPSEGISPLADLIKLYIPKK